ncbi:MAG: hypothetical protein KGJ57_06560 [Sphingomonadales bacterium]|nr:hypothetical protein [Sphingomonadales bacterium]MDE2169080.1 hypothetical protein [Sphingomonadales bacterium]
MNDDAQEAAWQRIETALTRLDAAARRLRERSKPGMDLYDEAHASHHDELSTQLREEQARHAALREALHGTLGRIDELIATHGQEQRA